MGIFCDGFPLSVIGREAVIVLFMLACCLEAAGAFFSRCGRVIMAEITPKPGPPEPLPVPEPPPPAPIPEPEPGPEPLPKPGEPIPRQMTRTLKAAAGAQ
jgi:hypothetical protein